MRFSKLLISLAFPLILFAWFPSAAHADEHEDLYIARRCLNDLARSRGDHHLALRCIAAIEKYQSTEASLVKCDGYRVYGGFMYPSIADFPWMLDETVDYPLITMLNHVFDVEVSKSFARKILTTCRGSSIGKVAHFGDFVYLKAVLLEVSTLKGNTLVTDLAGLTDERKIDEIEDSLQTLIAACNVAPTNVPLPLRSTSLCLELKRIEKAPGARFYDKLIYRLRVYG